MADNIRIIKGNIFNTRLQTIVNTINCVGVMGKGIALVFKLRYPNMFKQYQMYCAQGLIEIGKLWLYKGEPNAPWVLNFPTKTHWKLPSEYEYIEKGLQKFVDTYKEKQITSAAFPLLGASNGQLDSNRVLRIMQEYLSQCEIPIEIYQFDSTAPDDLFDLFKRRWNAIPTSELRALTGISTSKQIDIIASALNDSSICSMSALLNCKGIGLTTMQRCFALVMNP
jgi:O-acetyl-ADP-ribose deacetylase (regulator of RNase III)